MRTNSKNKNAPESKKIANCNSFETEHLSATDVANLLYEIAKKRKMIAKKKKTFASSATFSAIYNSSELESILNETIAKVIRSFQAYCDRRKGIATTALDLELDEEFDIDMDEDSDEMSNVIQFKAAPKISAELDLSTTGYLIGYFITAFNQNVSKDYKKHNGLKRKGDNVSYDGVVDEDDAEAHAVFNKMQVNTIEEQDEKEEFAAVIKKLGMFLRAYDKAVNLTLSRRKMQPKKDKQSQLSYMFLYLIDPKYKGKYVNIKDKFPKWSSYIYDKNLKTMVELLKQKFPEDLKFVYSYISQQDTQFGTTIRPKMSKNYYDQSCAVTSTFEEKFLKGEKVELILSINLYRNNNGKNEILETQTLKKESSLTNREEDKQKLKAQAEQEIKVMQKKAEERRSKCLAEIYNYQQQRA